MTVPLLFFAALMIKVDHATVAGLDIAKLQAEFVKLGLPMEYGGRHPNRTTEMAAISFPDGSYLELIAKQKDADEKSFATGPWAKLIEANVGPAAWAIRTDDPAGDVKRLRAEGIRADDPEPGGRTRPDGVRLEWQTIQVGEHRGTFFPFLIHDVTPHENRVYLKGKPSVPEFSGVSKVIIAVANLDEAIARYRKAFALPAPHKSVDSDLGATLASFEGTPVVLAAPASKDGWIADRVAKYGDLPCAFVIKGKKPGKTRWLKLEGVGGRIGIE
ncbi:MAG TPA: VOC family protein [Bryobacteraceae bacterium]|nr:VOC family protein [Bryobacteraceae bacterium]